MSATYFWLGTAPGLAQGGRLWRWGFGWSAALMLDVNVESTPSGSWAVNEIRREKSDFNMVGLELTHSIYNHPAVREAVINWLRRLESKRTESATTA